MRDGVEQGLDQDPFFGQVKLDCSSDSLKVGDLHRVARETSIVEKVWEDDLTGWKILFAFVSVQRMTISPSSRRRLGAFTPF